MVPEEGLSSQVAEVKSKMLVEACDVFVRYLKLQDSVAELDGFVTAEARFGIVVADYGKLPNFDVVLSDGDSKTLQEWLSSDQFKSLPVAVSKMMETMRGKLMVEASQSLEKSTTTCAALQLGADDGKAWTENIKDMSDMQSIMQTAHASLLQPAFANKLKAVHAGHLKELLGSLLCCPPYSPPPNLLLFALARSALRHCSNRMLVTVS